ncbi:hypothetical protein LLOABG_LLOABG_15455, partial [Dysosmobacter welbionis]
CPGPGSGPCNSPDSSVPRRCGGGSLRPSRSPLPGSRCPHPRSSPADPGERTGSGRPPPRSARWPVPRLPRSAASAAASGGSVSSASWVCSFSASRPPDAFRFLYPLSLYPFNASRASMVAWCTGFPISVISSMVISRPISRPSSRSL